VFSRGGAPFSPTRLLTVDETGRAPRRLTTGFLDLDPSWSPDGAKLAFSRDNRVAQKIYSVDLRTGTTKRLTRGDDPDLAPTWSPDARRLAFARFIDLPRHRYTFDIYTLDLTSLAVSRLVETPGIDDGPDWSPTGGTIAFASSSRRAQKLGGPGDRVSLCKIVGRPSSSSSIYAVQADGSGLRRLTSDPVRADSGPSWSPDGKQIAFFGASGGRSRIYVMNADGSGLRRLTAAHLDLDPVWSPDGKRVAFARANRRRARGIRCSTSIVVMDLAGGDSVRRLTSRGRLDLSPDWRPMPRPSSRAG
jgi:TolB protein